MHGTHEFKAFIEQSSKDQFGLKVNLPKEMLQTGCFRSVLMILIADDIKLCESIFGGVLRGIDFIYKDPGSKQTSSVQMKIILMTI